MNYRRLAYFLAVVDAGTVTAAARAIPVAQPALSRQIRTLERELTLTLFESHGNRLALTAAGRALVPVARRLMHQTSAFEGAAEALRTGRIDTLTLAATSASVRSFVAPFIATTTAADPRLLVRETPHFDIDEALNRGVDGIISPTPPAPTLAALALGSVAISAHVAADHPWARRRLTGIDPCMLADQVVILHSHRGVSRAIVDSAMSRAGASFGRVHACDDGQTILALAAAGHGVGITTEPARFGVCRLPIHDVDERAGPLRLPLHMAWPSDHFAADILADLAARIRLFFQHHLAVDEDA